MKVRHGKNSSPPPSQRQESRRFRINKWHVVFFLLGALVASLPRLSSWVTRSPAGLTLSQPSPDERSQPWGRLECTPFNLERPDESFSTNDPPSPLAWFFAGLSEQQVHALFETNELTAAQKLQLQDKTRWKFSAPDWIVSPPLDVVRDLSPAARKSIYSVLRKCPGNIYHFSPFRFASDQFDGWLKNCGLPVDKQELFRRLCYVEGDTWFFSDLVYMENVCTPVESLRLAKSISQTPTLLMKLLIAPGTDLEKLARYWGAAGRGQAMKPLLKSLARAPASAAINVSYFFPPFPRMRLYTYPNPEVDSLREDCIWTAMNFFNETPDPRFFEWEYTHQVIEAEYAPIQAPLVFGDLLMLLDARQQVIHMCVYVADDVVFTKNGYNQLQPWVLMKIPDMLRLFPAGKTCKIVGYRRQTK